MSLALASGVAVGDEADEGAGDGVGFGSGDAAVGPGSLVGVEGASIVLAQATRSSTAEANASSKKVTDRVFPILRMFRSFG